MAMKDKARRLIASITSQMPILLVLVDLHFEGVNGVNKAEGQKHLTIGNQLLHAGQLAEALTQYHAAIDGDPNNYQAYYMRATVYLAMGKARTALPDLDQVIRLQPNFVKARLQRGNLYLKMGRFNDAQMDYEVVLSQEDNAEAKEKVEVIRPLRRSIVKASQMMQGNNHGEVIHLLKEVIEACPWNAEFREMRAVAYEGVGDLRNAISDLKPTTSLRLDNTQGHLKISILYYNLGDVEQSLNEIRECLKLDPDHKDCYAHYKSVKKLFKTVEAGKRLMTEESWDEAIGKFSKALQQEPRIHAFSLELKLKICECSVKKSSPVESLTHCKDVLKFDERNIPAMLLMSEAYTLNSQYQEAVDILQQASQIDENYPGLNDKIKKAQKMLKQSQKRDYYKILGVSRNARKKEIEKAYRKLARDWHPDNFQSEEDKKAAEAKFIDLAAAKEVLTDPDKLRIYLAGYDPLNREDVEEWERGDSSAEIENIFKFFFQGSSNKNDFHKRPFSDMFGAFKGNKRGRQEEEDDDEDEEFLRESRRRKEEKMRREEMERMKREEEKRRAQEELRRREQEERQRRIEEEQRRQMEEIKKKQEELRRKEEQLRLQEEQRRQAEELKRRQEEQRRHMEGRQKEYMKEQDRKFREEQERRMQRAQEEQWRQGRTGGHPGGPQHTRADASGYQQREQKRPDAASSGYRQQEQKKPSGKTKTKPGSAGKAKSPLSGGTGAKSPRSSKKSSSKGKKKTKKSEKKKTSKESKTKKPKTPKVEKQYTMGTDGKWYEKKADGRWGVSAGPPSDSTSDNRSQKPTAETYEDERGNIFVKGNDGNWYMRVASPNSQTDTSRENTESSHFQQSRDPQRPHDRSEASIKIMAGGIYKDKLGRIVDREGNVYTQSTDGSLKIIGRLSASGSHGDQQTNRQRENRAEAFVHAEQQKYFHDRNGIPYYIDKKGNYIRVRGPEELKQQKRYEDTQHQYSYREESAAKAKERWTRQPDSDTSAYGHSRDTGFGHGAQQTYDRAASAKKSSRAEEIHAQIMKQQEAIAKKLMDEQIKQSQYYDDGWQSRYYDDGQRDKRKKYYHDEF